MIESQVTAPDSDSLRKAILEGIGASYLFSLGGLFLRRGGEPVVVPLLAAIFLFVIPFAGVAWGLGWHATRRLRVRDDWKRHLGHVAALSAYLAGWLVGATIAVLALRASGVELGGA